MFCTPNTNHSAGTSTHTGFQRGGHISLWSVELDVLTFKLQLPLFSENLAGNINVCQTWFSMHGPIIQACLPNRLKRQRQGFVAHTPRQERTLHPCYPLLSSKMTPCILPRGTSRRSRMCGTGTPTRPDTCIRCSSSNET